ncbi:MAG: integrase, partial [Pseudomonadota bacterium]
MRFRDWSQARTGHSPETANKDFGHLADVFRSVADLHGLNLASPFQGLRLRPAEKPENLPFSTDWIRTRLLPPEALAGLNTEARLAFLIMVNTGARPSEILGARVDDFMLAHEVPHLAIQPHAGRSLKTRQSRR